MKSFRPTLKTLLACVAACMLSACDQPIPGMYYKGTVSAPATPSLTQAYMDIVDEMVGDATEIVEMDRYLHGVRPAIDKIPERNPVLAANDANFNRYQSMYFKVYKVEVIDQYKKTISMDYRDHLPVDTSDAVHSWADRLRPTGGVNKLQVIIKDAPIQNASATDGSNRYDARLLVEMRITSRDGTVLASVSSVTAQSATQVGGSAGTDTRRAALNDMLARLIDTVNGDLENKMAQNFSHYIDRSKAV